MRTRIAIDEELLTAALKASGSKTTSEVVEEGLRLLVRRSEQHEIRNLRGRVRWEDNLDEMRSER